MLDGMGDLWDDSQYEREFDVEDFARKLGANSSGKGRRKG
jgi:hypothetical protein